MGNVISSLDSGLHPSKTAAQNQAALQAAVNSIGASGGGTITIPPFSSAVANSGVYLMQNSVVIGGFPGIEAIIGGASGNVS